MIRIDTNSNSKSTKNTISKYMYTKKDDNKNRYQHKFKSTKHYFYLPVHERCDRKDDDKNRYQHYCDDSVFGEWFCVNK